MDSYQRGLLAASTTRSSAAASAAEASPAVTNANDRPSSRSADNPTSSVPSENAVLKDLESALAPNSTFDSYLAFMTALHNLREATGMPKSNLAQKPSESFKDDEAEKIFGFKEYDGKSIVRRGRFYCTHKDGDVCCPFNVPISYISGEIVVKEGGNGVVCLNHNHHLAAARTHIEGKELIDKLADLTPEELAEIEEASLSLANAIPQIKHALRRKFPNKAFDSDLIDRIKRKALDKYYGEDRHRIPELLRNGEEVKRKGGVWEAVMCPDTLRLKGTHFQSAGMKPFAEEYGQYLSIVDGTHGTNIHKTTAVIWTTIDSLGLSVTDGLSTMLYEEAISIRDSAELMGVSGKCRACAKSEVR